MAMSYTVLTGSKSTAGSIKYSINYDGIDPDSVLEEAQTWIYDTLRVREMITTGSLSISTDDSSVALPDGFLEPIFLRDLTNDCEIGLRTEAELEIYRTYTNAVLDSGTPVYASVTGTNLEFDCKANADMTWRIGYFKQLDFLSGSNETNFLTTRYPHLLRKTVEAFAFSHANFNEDYTRCAQQATAMIAKANEMNERYRFGTEYSFTGA